jgi:DivIVA domain-containing protein
MTQETSAGESYEVFSPADIRAIRFQTSKYRGYERRMVDAFLDDVAVTVEALQQQLRAADAEVQRLQQRVIEGPRGDDVVQAVNIISNAQRTADGIVAEADGYSARVMTEARAAYDEASRRGAKLEQDAEQNVRHLAEAAHLQQDELDKQTAYLRTLRDATRTQMQKFLEGLLDHVAEEYGRAHPIAAEAAGTAHVASSEPDAEPDAEPDPEQQPEDARSQDFAKDSPNGVNGHSPDATYERSAQDPAAAGAPR